MSSTHEHPPSSTRAHVLYLLISYYFPVSQSFSTCCFHCGALTVVFSLWCSHCGFFTVVLSLWCFHCGALTVVLSALIPAFPSFPVPYFIPIQSCWLCIALLSYSSQVFVESCFHASCIVFACCSEYGRLPVDRLPVC